jgi:hypothetical protein
MRVEFQKSTFRHILLSLARWFGSYTGTEEMASAPDMAFYHRHAVSARQGIFRWDVDLTYYGIVVLPWLGIVRDLRPVPEAVRRTGTVPT